VQRIMSKERNDDEYDRKIDAIELVNVYLKVRG
jgi:hypothetical protein